MSDYEFSSTVRQLIQQLEEVSEDYWADILPSPIDSLVSSFVQVIIEATEEDRLTLQSFLDRRAQMTLLAFADRMTMLSLYFAP